MTFLTGQFFVNSRSELLAGLAGVALTGWSPLFTARLAQLDVDDTATNLRAFIRLRGSLGSDPDFFVAERGA